MSLSTASNWLWNFGIGYATPYLVDPSTPGPTGIKAANLGAKVFFIWGTMCVGCFVFTYFCIPETKGLSLEQIDLLYHNTTPRKSLAYRRRLLEEDIHASQVVGAGGAGAGAGRLTDEKHTGSVEHTSTEHSPTRGSVDEKRAAGDAQHREVV